MILRRVGWARALRMSARKSTNSFMVEPNHYMTIQSYSDYLAVCQIVNLYSKCAVSDYLSRCATPLAVMSATSQLFLDEGVEFLFVRKADCTSRAKPSAGAALHHAVVRVTDRGFLNCLVKCQNTILANADAFTATDTFFCINGWEPWNFFTWYTSPFAHDMAPF